jgi:hypothetical protein
MTEVGELFSGSRRKKFAIDCRQLLRFGDALRANSSKKRGVLKLFADSLT